MRETDYMLDLEQQEREDRQFAEQCSVVKATCEERVDPIQAMQKIQLELDEEKRARLEKKLMDKAKQVHSSILDAYGPNWYDRFEDDDFYGYDSLDEWLAEDPMATDMGELCDEYLAGMWHDGQFYTNQYAVSKGFSDAEGYVLFLKRMEDK